MERELLFLFAGTKFLNPCSSSFQTNDEQVNNYDIGQGLCERSRKRMKGDAIEILVFKFEDHGDFCT